MKISKTLLTGLAALTIGSGVGHAQTLKINFDRTFYTSGVQWGSGVDTIVFTKLIEFEGKVAVCGAYLNENGGIPATVMRQYISGLYISANNTLVLRNAKHYQRLKNREELSSRQAKCKVTKMAWQKAMAKAKVNARNPKTSYQSR
jgi:hypothetical protein